ncbi:hypothetical protein AC249_AIPGENE27895, partial [Exaiptasia diaphana]
SKQPNYVVSSQEKLDGDGTQCTEPTMAYTNLAQPQVGNYKTELENLKIQKQHQKKR